LEDVYSRTHTKDLSICMITICDALLLHCHPKFVDELLSFRVLSLYYFADENILYACMLRGIYYGVRHNPVHRIVQAHKSLIMQFSFKETSEMRTRWR